MAAFKHMVSMARSDDEKTAAHLESMFPPTVNTPDVPHGLCICLTEAELEKLDLDDDAQIGDMIHGFFMARVTSISKNDNGAGAKCRIELAITDLALEDEDTETGPDMDD